MAGFYFWELEGFEQRRVRARDLVWRVAARFKTSVNRVDAPFLPSPSLKTTKHFEQAPEMARGL